MKLKYIDALRGIAILMVIATHTFFYTTQYADIFLSKVIPYGARGVQLFFIVSAFTLFLSFNHRKKKETKVNLKFFIRRFFRIAPMYYLGIIYFLFQDGLGPRYWLGDLKYISTSNIVSNFLFLNDYNPYWITSIVPGGWSIGVEMSFYVIIPIIVFRLKSLSASINFTLFSIIIMLMLKTLFTSYVLISSERLWNEYLFFYFPNQLPVFGCGIILYFLIIKKDFRLTLFNYSMGIITVIMLFVKSDLISSNLPFGLIFSLFIYILSKIRLSIFVNQLMVFIGNISYSAYLVHFAMLYWMNYYKILNIISVDSYSSYIFNFILNFSIVCILTTFISFIFYKGVEKPFINYGKKIIQQLD